MRKPHVFAVVRGVRGYRPAQVDRVLAGLSEDRDAAWERAARLTVLAREMEEEAARLCERVEGLAPQRYEVLGERARKLLLLAEEEADELVAAATEEARTLRDEAEAAAEALAEAARAEADGALAAVEGDAEELLEVARGEAEAVRAGARGDAAALREEARTAVGDARLRAVALVDAREQEQAVRRAETERAAAAHEEEWAARYAERVALAEAELAEAERVFAEAEQGARRRQDAADGRAGELLAGARATGERVARETDRILAEHATACEATRAHMAHVRNSLATLTGRAAQEEGESAEGAATEGETEGGE